MLPLHVVKGFFIFLLGSGVFALDVEGGDEVIGNTEEGCSIETESQQEVVGPSEHVVNVGVGQILVRNAVERVDISFTLGHAATWEKTHRTALGIG